jgi:hypothetical protein
MTTYSNATLQAGDLTFAAGDLERAVLGALLMDPDAYDKVKLWLYPEHFLIDRWRWTFEAIADLRDDGRPADFVTVPDELDRRQRLWKDGTAAIMELSVDNGDSWNVEDYARRLVERSAQQKAANLLRRGFEDLHRNGHDAPGVIERVAAGIEDIKDTHVTANGYHGPTWVLPAERKRIWTTPELLSTDFPEPKWAIPGIVPVGLTYLAGRPKLGKSWLALQMAIAVGSGGRVFDEPIAKGKVLYLALEDSERRIKERTLKQGIIPTAEITWATEWPALTDGGADKLLDALQTGGYSFVVVDTLSRVLGDEDQGNQASMTVILGNLQRMAQTLEVAVLMVDHHRKPGSFEANQTNDLLGATAKAAVADAILGLYKQQGKAGAQLAITGRDMEERTLALQFDPVTWCWQCLGDAGAVARDTVMSDILVAIERLQELGELPTPTAIADLLGKKKQNVYAELVDLVNKGLVVKGVKQGKLQPYCLAGQAVGESEPEDEEEPN